MPRANKTKQQRYDEELSKACFELMREVDQKVPIELRLAFPDLAENRQNRILTKLLVERIVGLQMKLGASERRIARLERRMQSCPTKP